MHIVRVFEFFAPTLFLRCSFGMEESLWYFYCVLSWMEEVGR